MPQESSWASDLEVGIGLGADAGAQLLQAPLLGLAHAPALHCLRVHALLALLLLLLHTLCLRQGR